MINVDMDVIKPEGIRRLPIYLLLDCSGSMQGAPIEAVRRGIEQFTKDVQEDEFAKQTVHIGVIVFGETVELVTNGLIPIENFKPPLLVAEGQTPLGQALRLLQQSLNADVKLAIKGGEKGDWKPLIFILTDGEPTDDWQTPREEILKRQERKVMNVITVGCGPAINEQNLKAIAIGPTFRMDNSDKSFKAFFGWVSQSVQNVAKGISQPGGAQQPQAQAIPPPQVIQYIP